MVQRLLGTSSARFLHPWLPIHYLACRTIFWLVLLLPINLLATRCGEVIVKQMPMFKPALLSFSMAIAAIAASSLSAHAEEVAKATRSLPSEPASATAPSTVPASTRPALTPEANLTRAQSEAAPVPAIQNTVSGEPATPTAAPPVATQKAKQLVPSAQTAPMVQASQPAANLPAPGSATTKAAGLYAQEPTTPPTAAATETRYQFSYVGAGVNLGTGADSGLGKISFAAFSKFALNPYLSFRPSVLISSDTSFLFPVTYDFPIAGPGKGVAPYVGAGVMFSTGKDSNVDLLLSGGIDLPINNQWAVTAGVNIGPFDKFDIGFLLGVAYIFSSATVETPVVKISELVPKLPTMPARSNPSYVGVGVNLGVTGDRALGDLSAAIFGKLALNSAFSVRPAMLIKEDVTFLIPVTYDFVPVKTEYLTLAPFLGTGVALSTRGGSNASFLLTGGLDVPIAPQLTFTTSANIAPIGGLDVGFLLGIAYTFGKY